MREILLMIAGVCLMSGSKLPVPMVGEGRGAPQGARSLSMEEAAGYTGSGQGEQEPVSKMECVATSDCSEMAEESLDMGCPRTVILPFNPNGCPTQTCILLCDNSAVGGFCKAARGSCKDTSLEDGPPESCGNGEVGHCNYTSIPLGPWNMKCVSQGLCYSDGILIDCGIVRKCE